MSPSPIWVFAKPATSLADSADFAGRFAQSCADSDAVVDSDCGDCDDYAQSANRQHLQRSGSFLSVLTSPDFTEAEDPVSLFRLWLEEAAAAEVNDPEAMVLATVDEGGLPDARTLLCKGADARGLVFYGNVESAKGRELAVHPKAAALFHWKSLRRQTRFRGPVSPISEAEADAYFASRPRQSRIGAWASQQSRPLDSRAALETAVESYAKRFGEGDIPRPPYWRGWRLEPLEIEFWGDGAFRLHDRVRFTRATLESPWERRRLFP
jgi:pyridoxamine 5'-phosphate oxidase